VTGFVPDDVRGSATAWWRVARRELDRRRIAARHAHAVRAHERAIRSARRWTARYACAATAALVAVPLSSGWSEVVWGATSGVLATGAGLSAREARRRDGRRPPLAPPAPAALPGPPPLGSAAWPALRRIDVASAALRRLAATAPRAAKDALTPTVAAAIAVEDEARRQAWRIGLAEADPRHSAGGLAADLADLDRAADAVEDLLASAEALLDGGGHGASALRSAIDDATARAYGLRVAAGRIRPASAAATGRREGETR
jgi:hypothetical protein